MNAAYSIEQLSTLTWDRLLAEFVPPSELPANEDVSLDPIRWDACLGKLLEWRQSPSQLEDDGVPAPSRKVLDEAYRLGQALQGLGFPVPTWVVPDAQGGIVFEWDLPGCNVGYGVTSEGDLEWTVLVDGKIARHTICPMIPGVARLTA